MKIVDKIMVLAQKIALSILKKNKIDQSEINVFFDSKDADTIVNQLTNRKHRRIRNEQYQIINKTKKEDWELLLERIEPDYKGFDYGFFVKIAAFVVLFLGISFVFITKTKKISTTAITVINKDDITLKHDNGTIEVIATNGNKKIIDANGQIIGNQDGLKLSYKTGLSIPNNTILPYNELHVPNGKKITLIMSDGTVVHLNSGSNFKFPTQFKTSGNRKVFLKGEAFFDVTKDKKHPFVVNTDNLDIRVLGTKFNVSSFPEDQFSNTVLVEGSVCLSGSQNSSKTNKTDFLSPGNKATWNKVKKENKIEKVDTALYTAWMDGKIVFEHIAFKNILKKLERHYNVTIINTNKALAEETFTASFDIETIEQVLNTFSKSYPIKYYKEKDQIVIK